MIFSRTILASICAGLLAGLVLNIAQILAVNPIIFAAESFEAIDVPVATNEQSHAHSHGHSHSHDGSAWAPQDGFERNGYTLVANIAAGIGFAAILLALMSQMQVQGVAQKITPVKGVWWGIGGFLAFFVVPSLGMPPEIPGAEAAVIEHRQLWWVLTVLSAGVGLLILAFAPIKLKVMGGLLLVLPYIVTIPVHHGPMFSHPDANVVAQLTMLHEKFIVVTSVSNLLFWLAIGVASAWLLNTWVLQKLRENGQAVASA